jgi:transposase-like protein
MNDVVREQAPEDAGLCVPGLVISRKADGRANYSKPGKAALVEMVRSSVASLPALARANGINANMLAKWVQQHSTASKRRPVVRTAPTLLPVALKPELASSRMSCEIVLARATLRLQLDGPGLRAVIEQLNR